jgi:hypothetical protein
LPDRWLLLVVGPYRYQRAEVDFFNIKVFCKLTS